MTYTHMYIYIYIYIYILILNSPKVTSANGQWTRVVCAASQERILAVSDRQLCAMFCILEGAWKISIDTPKEIVTLQPQHKSSSMFLLT